MGRNQQDTNTTQYELMRCFAKADGGVSVVGDPDQSIYGWRSAEVENLNRMTSGRFSVFPICSIRAEAFCKTFLELRQFIWSTITDLPDPSSQQHIPSYLRVSRPLVVRIVLFLTLCQTESVFLKTSTLRIQRVLQLPSRPFPHQSSKPVL